MLVAVRTVELLAERARGEGPGLAWFAAGEISRDVLGAPALARNLFLEYGGAGGPWAGKALLAALALTSEERERSGIRSRLDELSGDPYVATARGEGWAGPDVERLESALGQALDVLLGEVSAQAAELDVLVRERSDTVS
jgi:hypothetical protein